MINRITLFVCFLVSYSINAQQNFISLHSFYKDQVFANKLEKSYNGGSFFPVSEANYNLIPAIRDSSKQYYKFTQILFKKHLIELKGEDFFLTIDPVLNIAYGKNFSDTSDNRLFQNTRGLHVEGDLFKSFSFSTTVYENQARFNAYETAYYSSVGELYPRPDSTYLTQNAVIPGSARTKPFKGDGFDYASAVGYFTYAPFKTLRISAGNNQQFVGDGHRSVLLSDNSISAPYFRIDWRISSKFSATYLRVKHLHLLRKPTSSSAESYYEQKGYSVNYFTYHANDKISVSLFESGNWNRGDSISSRSAHPLYYNPVPFVSGLALKNNNEVVSLVGLNLSYQIAEKHRLYGQFAINDFDRNKLAAQFGYRGYNYFGIRDFMFQFEYNYVAEGMYEAKNRRLNNTQYNLPLAHTKGSGFQEFIVRSNYEIKRLYIDLSIAYYITQNYSSVAHLPIYEDFNRNSNAIFYENLELGYRINRKMNLTIFGSWTYRTEENSPLQGTNAINLGIRTGLINHYKDF